MSMAWRNIVAGSGMLAFSAWYAWLAIGLPERSLPNTPGPSFFPLVVISLVAVLSAALVIKGAVALRGDRHRPRRRAEPHLPALTIAVFFVYLAALPFAGFIVASIPFFAALMFLYGSRKPPLICVASTAIPLALFLIFRYGFQIVLPYGVLGF
jgi:putative tricarboxylic transport membrane protein